jgi:hypothetical protein
LKLSVNVHITSKGEDEIKRRAYKLDMKKRSLLLMLDRPQTIEYLTRKTVLPQDEFNAALIMLIQEGFVATGSAASDPVEAAPVTANSTLHIDDEVILSEAKFLLTNFCVDSFGTKSQGFVDAIRSARSVSDLRHHLNAIHGAAEKSCPEQIPTLLGVIQEINSTA